MSDAFRTLIVTADDAPLARSIAALSPGGEGMWVTGLSPSGEEPATHYVSTGLIPPNFAAVCPEQVYEQDEDGNWVLVSSTPGNPAAVFAMCEQAEMSVTLAEIEAVFQSSDVTAQEPFVAFGRLGLAIVQEGEI